MSYREVYEKWCNDPYFDEASREELKALEGNEAEIEDRFYRQLEFGTGGLRGVIGAGTNRMNIYTVRQATQGLANYIISQNGQEKGVAIAHDSRRMSPEFAREAALCLNANGIKTYLFESLRPTPELSFAVREFGCISGIVITASHNPREYNGYKVYWEDGAQITPPHDKNILAEVAKVTEFSAVKTMEEDDARAEGLFQVIGTDFDDRYVAKLKEQSIHPEIIKDAAKDMKIVYTPLHGTGNVPVRRVLRELGFNQVYVVKEQKVPDGNFPTVAYPNPEDEKAWTLALKLAKEVDADIILATDPDADRLGVYAKDSKTGEYVSFTGNMSGMLIAEYILRERTKNGTMPENPALVETIVTTDMAKAIAKAYNVALIEVLTGFKYIGEQIKFFEQSGAHNYVFGLEESYGCLAGTYARDKDACVAVMMLCEVAAYYKQQGKTLWDAMVDMYEEYGYYKDDHHGAKSRTAQSGHCGPPGVVGHRAHQFQRRSLCLHRGIGLLQKGRKHPALRGLRRRSRSLGAGCGSGPAGQNAGLPRLRRGLFADSRCAGAGRLGSGALRHPHAHFEPVGGFTARPARPRAGPLHGF